MIVCRLSCFFCFFVFRFVQAFWWSGNHQSFVLWRTHPPAHPSVQCVGITKACLGGPTTSASGLMPVRNLSAFFLHVDVVAWNHRAIGSADPPASLLPPPPPVCLSWFGGSWRRMPFRPGPLLLLLLLASVSCGTFEPHCLKACLNVLLPVTKHTGFLNLDCGHKPFSN